MPTLTQRIARKAFKPFYPLYYRWVWGRDVPFAGALSRGVDAWEALAGRGDTPMSAGAWDAEYASGRWNLLQRPAEVPRYSLLVGYVLHLMPRATVLDVGCGEGLLATHLGAHGYARYLGVDLSAQAVAAAETLPLERARFVAADATTWAPDEPFDVTIFNECLYYFDRPLEVAERYWTEHRAPGGLIISSMFETPRSSAILRRLERGLPVVTSSKVTNASGTWTITVFGEDTGR